MRRNLKFVILILPVVVVMRIFPESRKLKQFQGKTPVNRQTNLSNHVFSSINYENTSTKRRLPFVKVKGARMYMMAATSFHRNKQFSDTISLLNVTSTDKQRAKNKALEIAVTGWYIGNTKTDVLKANVTCCLKDSNGTLTVTNVTGVIKAFQSKIKTIETVRYVCLARRSEAAQVSLVYETDRCDENNLTYYLPVETIVTTQPGSVGVCAKIVYGNVEAERLVEWLEAQIYLGVDKVFIYCHANLNKRARQVFEHYSKTGFVQTFPFVVPENDTYHRFPQAKNVMVWTDEQVTIFDCQERLNAYTYGVFLDVDEIVLPEKNSGQNSLKEYLKEAFSSSSTTGALTFKTRIHTTPQNFSSKPDDMFLARHLYSTGAFIDRPKNAIMMDRVPPGSCSAHTCYIKPGFSRDVVNEKDASVHHFRSCRNEWLKTENEALEERLKTLLNKNAKGNICSRFNMTRSTVLERLANAIRDNIIRALLRLPLG